MLYHHRMIGSGRIKVPAVERSRRLGIVIQKSDHPLPRRRRSRLGVDRRGDGRDRGHLEGYLSEQCHATIAGVRMCVIESGRHALSAQIDATRIRPRQSEHLMTCADREHAVAGEREGLDFALARRHRHDPAVVQDRVRAPVPAGEGGWDGTEPCEDETTAAEASSHGSLCFGVGVCEQRLAWSAARNAVTGSAAPSMERHATYPSGRTRAAPESEIPYAAAK